MTKKSKEDQPKVSDAEIATQFDVETEEVEEANAMAAASKPNDGPSVRIFLILDEESQTAFNDRKFGYIPWKNLVATTSKSVTNGGIQPSGEKNEEGDVIVNMGLSMLEQVISAYRDYQETLPVSQESATGTLKSARDSLEFLESNNSGVNFEKANDLLNQGQKILVAKTFGEEGSDDNFKEVKELGKKAEEIGHAVVIAHLTQRCRTLGDNFDDNETARLIKLANAKADAEEKATGTRPTVEEVPPVTGTKDAVETWLTTKIEPTAGENPVTARKALLTRIRALIVGGAKDKETPPPFNAPRRQNQGQRRFENTRNRRRG